MIDQSKRNTLKTLTVAVGSIAGGTVAGSALGSTATHIAGMDDLALANIEVSTRVSALHNDLEVVIKNAGEHAVTITHMTPGIARVARGEFDFAALLKNGPLHLDIGQSVAVPMQRLPVQINSSTSVSLLNDALKKSMSVVTENNSFASVSVLGASHV